jgi:hypothetical protein
VLLWCAGLAAVAGVLAQAWCARRYDAEWDGPWLTVSYACGTALLSLRAGSLTQGLILVAIASTTLVIVTTGHVERLEDSQWKPYQGAVRAALKHRQRWVLARWLGLVMASVAVDAALGGLKM